MSKRTELKLENLFSEAVNFVKQFEETPCPELAGVTDGKAIGTFVEHKFKDYLSERYFNLEGNSAHGVDLSNPALNTDIKATYIKQPQSSCPYKSASQKIFGLGYNLIVFVYDRVESSRDHSITIINVTFISANKTGDYTLTTRLQEMIKDKCSVEDIAAYFADRCLPGDDITYEALAKKVLDEGVEQGFLTISNALQWRLQYKRVIELSNSQPGIKNYDKN